MHVRIHGVPFQVAAPYSAGHVLTRSEAEAMNALVADNLRRLLAARLAPLLAHGTTTAYREAQSRVSGYAAGYKLSAGPTSPSPLEREVLRLGPEGLTDFWSILASPVGPKVLRTALDLLAARRAAGSTTGGVGNA